MALTYSEKLLTDSTSDFNSVRHLVLRGTNREIGRKLGEITIERHGLVLNAGRDIDPFIITSTRNYFRHHYPVHLQRSSGVADAFGVDPDDDRYFTFCLPYNMDIPPGCSVVFYPASSTEEGKSYLSRNFDFFTESIIEVAGIQVPPHIAAKVRPMMADTYVIEMYPEDGGYPSLYINNNDLLGGCYDGINAAGLTVALMSDSSSGSEPNPFGIGLSELLTLRLLLDTCATVEEAKQALLLNRQFYSFVPCHYIIADGQGKSFVYEHSEGRNREYFIDGDERPQIVTNHLLHKQLNAAASAPAGQAAEKLFSSTHARYDDLEARIANEGKKFSEEFVKNANCCVFAGESAVVSATQVSERTLWHTLYNLDDLVLEASFYLGETEDKEGNVSVSRSGYFQFRLELAKS